MGGTQQDVLDKREEELDGGEKGSSGLGGWHIEQNRRGGGAFREERCRVWREEIMSE